MRSSSSPPFSMRDVVAVRTVRYSGIRGDTHVSSRLLTHSSMGYLLYCTGACATLSFAFRIWRPGIGLRNYITETLFGGFFFCILFKFTHFKFVGPNHCRWVGTIYASGP